MNAEQKDTEHHSAITSEQMEQIREFANSIRYGSITLVLQDGILTQIEKSEKIRLHPK